MITIEFFYDIDSEKIINNIWLNKVCSKIMKDNNHSKGIIRYILSDDQKLLELKNK